MADEDALDVALDVVLDVALDVIKDPRKQREARRAREPVVKNNFIFKILLVDSIKLFI